jgi:hypothetical protein
MASKTSVPIDVPVTREVVRMKVLEVTASLNILQQDLKPSSCRAVTFVLAFQEHLQYCKK